MMDTKNDKINEKRRARYQLYKDSEAFKQKNRENAKLYYIYQKEKTNFFRHRKINE